MNSGDQYTFSVRKPHGAPDAFWQEEIRLAYRQAAVAILDMARANKSSPVTVGPIIETIKREHDGRPGRTDVIYVSIPVSVANVMHFRPPIARTIARKFTFQERVKIFFTGKLKGFVYYGTPTE